MRVRCLLVCVLAGCGQSAPPPELVAVEPATVSRLASTRATLRGRNLSATVRVTLDNDEAPALDLGWRVKLGEVELPRGDVTLVERDSLAIVVPAGLAEGAHDVEAISPAGQLARLPAGLRVIVAAPSACGDGTCEPGEDACGCPADCGPARCGDGVCCGDETRCGCPADCGESTCGDGCCSAAELADGSCAGDCMCQTGCDTACMGAPCCTHRCTGERCTLPDCGCAACDLDCRGARACEGTCHGPRACKFNCTGVNECRMRCTEGASCNLTCARDKTCALECVASTCEVRCTTGNNCDQTRCLNGSRCLVRCRAAANCRFEICEGAEMSCPGKVVVCNRPCP